LAQTALRATPETTGDLRGELARIAQMLAIEAVPEVRRDKSMGPELPPAP
jgi:hypothetical protein